MDINDFDNLTNRQVTIRNEEHVTCMFLRRKLPVQYVTLMNSEYEEALERAKSWATALPDKPELSLKEGGVAWEVVIISRNTVGYQDQVWNINDMKMPDYNVFCEIWHPSPRLQLRLTSKKGFLYGDRYRKGGLSMLDGDTGLPIIGDLFKSVSPEIEWAPNIPFELRMRADKVPEDKKNEYKTLLEKENKRVEWWNTLIKEYEKLRENEAITWLERALSRRYLLYDQKDNSENIVYLEPKKGMTFTAVVESFADSKYFNINVINKGKILPGLRTERDVNLPNDITLTLADKIIDLYDSVREEDVGF